MRNKLIAFILAAVTAAGAVTVALAMPRQSEQFVEVVKADLSALPVVETTALPERTVTMGLAAQSEAELPTIPCPIDDRGDVLQELINEGKAKKEAEEARKKAEEEAKKKAEAEADAAQEEDVVYSGTGGEVAQKALQYVGYPYVYGGSGPNSFDCSGFTMYIYGLYGYKLPHGATGQMYNHGTPVDKANLQPGDLVFFSPWPSGSGVGHVGIYIGNSEFVHASTSTTGVIISSLNTGSYVTRYLGARRIF